MKQCPNCKCQVGTGISVCPYCEAPLPPDEFYGAKRPRSDQTSVPAGSTGTLKRNWQSVPVPGAMGNTGYVTEAYTGPLPAASFPINTVKTNNTPVSAGYQMVQDYGTYTLGSPSGYYYSPPTQSTVTYPVYSVPYQAMPIPEEPAATNNNYWLLAGLLVFMGFSVIELILLLVLLLIS